MGTQGTGKYSFVSREVISRASFGTEQSGSSQTNDVGKILRGLSMFDINLGTSTSCSVRLDFTDHSGTFRVPEAAGGTDIPGVTSAIVKSNNTEQNYYFTDAVLGRPIGIIIPTAWRVTLIPSGPGSVTTFKVAAIFGHVFS